MGFGSDKDTDVRIDDTPDENGMGVAVSTLATTRKAQIERRQGRSDLANTSVQLGFRFLSSPGFAILAAGGAVAMLFWGLGSQRPDYQLANKQTEMLERRLETLDRQTKLQTEQMGELSEMLRSATRPSNNFALIQWGMESNSAVMQGSGGQPQQVALTYEQEQNLAGWRDYCASIGWTTDPKCDDVKRQMRDVGWIQ